MAFPNAHMLVDVAWLREHLDDPDLLVIDCGWDEAAFGRAHIRGAVRRPGHAYVKALNHDGSRGTHVTGRDDFRALCQRMGIAPRSDVIVYDDWGGLFASRLWWALRYYGFERVRLLDGGWQAWVTEEGPVTFEVRPPADVEPLDLQPDPARIILTDEIVARLGDPDLQIFDVRTEDEYFGRNDRENRRAGRIPGAKNLEWNRVLENSTDQRAVRRLRPESEVRALIDGVGLDPAAELVTHCQAAIRATYSAFILEMMGYPPVRVYDGSSEEWANRDDTPLDGP